jgi:chromosome segregation ATPase
LNIVVGANGTGKSSILNAICLGLGGEPKLLGRADDARDYVMHGKDKAFIEITLSPFPGKPAHVIQRIIDKHRGSERGQGRGASTFYLNGDKVNIKEVKELVSNTYKISIDNLCTFLPQDKVSSFSSMSEQDRLIETEKTLDGDFYNMHLELMAQEADLTDASGDLESMQQRLKKYQHENEQLERAAALVAERQKALDQAELINKKKLWVEFEALRNRALELKSAKADVKKRILEVTAQLQPLQEKEDKLAALRQKAEASHKAHNDETNRCKKEIDKQGKKFDNHDDRIEDMLTQLSEIDSKRSQAEAEVKAKQDRVNAMENNLKTIPSLQEADAELKEAQAKRRETAKKHDRAKRNEQEIDHQIKELEEQGQHYQQKLARLENVVDARKRQVFRQFGNLSKISQMIEPERGSFRRQVWGPVACEIDAKSQDIAGMLEQHVPNAAFKTFVVEEKRDYDRLYKWIRLDKSIPININVVHNGELKPVRRIYSDKKMAILKQQHGIQGYLDECFTAPDAIMQFLRSSAAVHRVLVGNTKTMDSINKKGLLDYLAEPEHGHEKVSYCVFAMNGRTIRKYSGTVSKYSHKIAMAQDEILDPRFLSAGVDDSEKQQVGAKLSEIHEQADSLRPKVQEAQHIRRQLEAEAQEASGETEAAQKKKAQIVKFHEKHKQAKRQLREAIAGLDTDDNETKKSLVTSLTNSVSNSITALISHARQQEIMLTSTIAGAGAAANKSSVAAAATEAR